MQNHDFWGEKFENLNITVSFWDSYKAVPVLTVQKPNLAYAFFGTYQITYKRSTKI